jgi:hypothetical protein
MKQSIAIVAALALAACTSISQSTRISTPLQAAEFNSLASRYMGKPTFVSTEKMSDGADTLMVHMETYALPTALQGSTLPASTLDTLRYSEIRFLKEDVPAYVAAIDKYLQWEALAKERKDQFTKDIARVPAWSQAKGAGFLVFSFHSGNDREHFLVIQIESLGVLVDGAQFYDESNATELKRLLLAFASDSLQHTDIDSVYK